MHCYFQKSLDAGMKPYVVQFDFSAVFDGIRTVLLFKLRLIGVGGSELQIC